jgi:hypothetical protein
MRDVNNHACKIATIENWDYEMHPDELYTGPDPIPSGPPKGRPIIIFNWIYIKINLFFVPLREIKPLFRAAYLYQNCGQQNDMGAHPVGNVVKT